ncbi:MAG: ThuA domain-containing protein [Candidatus Latescibacteria bacterium]|nr:ThuA domain-containing protein [Candidatus Latescibacterota bacterium]
MSKYNTLVFAGGQIHDYKSTGPAIMNALSECKDLTLTYVEEDLDVLISPNLDQYDLIVFYYTVGEISDAQKNGLLNWVASGKGYAGVHSAADSFRTCPEYRAMVGGHFVTHPHYRDYQVSVIDQEHAITEGLTEFTVTDEQYILDYDPRNQVLCSALYNGRAVPVAWTKSWGEGRVFYLALGHDGKACEHENFRSILQRGATWAAQPLEA